VRWRVVLFLVFEQGVDHSLDPVGRGFLRPRFVHDLQHRGLGLCRPSITRRRSMILARDRNPKLTKHQAREALSVREPLREIVLS
jgi:hypothetical protein